MLKRLPTFERDKIRPIITVTEKETDTVELDRLHKALDLQVYPTPSILSDLYYKIGCLYEKHNDQEYALEYYYMASRYNNAEAMYRMSYIYKNGKSVWAMNTSNEVIYSPHLSKKWYEEYCKNLVKN